MTCQSGAATEVQQGKANGWFAVSVGAGFVGGLPSPACQGGQVADRFASSTRQSRHDRFPTSDHPKTHDKALTRPHRTPIDEEVTKPTNMVPMVDATAPDRQPPRSPDHVVVVPAGGDDGAERVDPKLRREVAVSASDDNGESDDDDDDRTKHDDDDIDAVPGEEGDDDAENKADVWHPLLFDAATMSNSMNATTDVGYAALGSGSESDFGASPGWMLNGSDGEAGAGEGLLDRMFSQECVQLTLDAHELLAEELSDVRRNLFPNAESMSSSSSSSSVKETKHKDGEGHGGMRRPPTSLRMSIEKIREEASRVDAALALDQLETVQQELEETRRQLRNRRQELDEQRVVIKLKDDRLATLELERDLYKADATLVRSPHKRPPWRRDKSSHSASTGSGGSDASRSAVPRVLERHPPPPPLYEEEPSCLSSKASSASDADSSLDSSANRGDRLFDSNLRRTSALEAKCLLGTKRLASILVARRKREKDRLSSMQQPPDTRTEATTQSSPLKASGHTTIPRSSASSKTQGPGPRAPAATLHEEWVQNQRPPDTWSLEKQMEDLQERLRASMETADELRRRLASIHFFYEKAIRTLQLRWQASERWHHHHFHPTAEAEAGAEAAADHQEVWHRAQVEHVRNAKRRVVDALEAKLREKDDEIERLSTLAYDEI